MRDFIGHAKAMDRIGKTSQRNQYGIGAPGFKLLRDLIRRGHFFQMRAHARIGQPLRIGCAKMLSPHHIDEDISLAQLT